MGLERYSLLEKIDMYVRNYGFPFRSISISSTYFPEYFNKVVLEELNKTLKDLNKRCEEFISEYIITYDETDTIKLMAYASNGLTRVVIYPKDVVFDNTIGKKISEYDIIDKAKDMEIMAFNELMVIARSRGLGSALNVERIAFTKRLKASTKRCIAYIDFWNKEYTMKLKQEEEEKQSMIHYIKPEPVGEVRTLKAKGTGKVRKNVRINNILSIDERKEALEAYDYLYKGYSYTDSKEKITHMNYIYSIGENCYALVIEPYSGDGFTKTLLHKTKEPMTQKRFEQLVRYVLDIPYTEVLKRRNIILTNHTTKASYEDTLSIILRGVAKYNNEKLKKTLSKVADNGVEYWSKDGKNN